MKLDIAVTIDHFLICNRFLHIITLKINPKKTKDKNFHFLAYLKTTKQQEQQQTTKNTSKNAKKPHVYFSYI